MPASDPALTVVDTQDKVASDRDIMEAAERAWPAVSRAFAGQRLDMLSRSAIATRVGLLLAEQLNEMETPLNLLQRRKLIDSLIGRLEAQQAEAPPVDLL